VFTAPDQAGLSLTIKAWSKTLHTLLLQLCLHLTSCALRRDLDAFPIDGREHPKEVAGYSDFQMV